MTGMIDTSASVQMDKAALKNYLRNLVNLFFKILPIQESEEASVVPYMKSLQVELLGCRSLICALQDDSHFVTLLAILQFLIDHPDSSHQVFKREVFKAISICNKLSAQYASA